MRILFVSKQGDSAGLAVRCRQEGHDVYFYCEAKNAKYLLQNLVTRVKSIKEGLDNGAELIVFDMVGFGKIADKLRKEGYPVFGGGVWNDKLELDRTFAVKTMELMGIKAPPSWAFRNFKEAAKWAAKQKGRFVFKPHDNKNTSFTYVASGIEDLVAYIMYLKKHGIDGKCILQKYIEGIEISTEYWFSKGKPVPYPNGTFEYKKLLPDGLGPSTGCQASLVWFYDKKEPRIVQQTLKKMFYFMEKLQYSGPLDINGIVRNGRFYGLEFSPRLGYSAIYALLALIDEPLGELLYRVAAGDETPIEYKKGFGYALRVAVPPYPIVDDTQAKAAEFSKDILILGVKKKWWGENVFPLDVYAGKGGLRTAGTDGCVLECVAHGDDPTLAELSAWDIANNIILPNKIVTKEQLASKAMGAFWELRGMKYEVPINMGDEDGLERQSTGKT